MKKKSKDTVLTPNAGRAIIDAKGGVNNMTKEMERFTLRIPKERKEQLKMCSTQIGVSLNSLILQILREWAKKNVAENGQDSA